VETWSRSSIERSSFANSWMPFLCHANLTGLDPDWTVQSKTMFEFNAAFGLELKTIILGTEGYNKGIRQQNGQIKQSNTNLHIKSLTVEG